MYPVNLQLIPLHASISLIKLIFCYTELLSIQENFLYSYSYHYGINRYQEYKII